MAGATPYDLVPYHSFPYYETHPEWLRLLGHLFGLEAAPPASCRVLEIACAGGGNLVPMAERYPDSRFTGIDLAATQIEQGRELVAALGLANIELRAQDLVDLDPAEGPFDYVICHGVYSWVSPEVRARLLDVVAALLAPRGIALVSHNVKPGWYPRVQAREMMLWHAGSIADPGERVANARNFLSFLIAAARPDEERHRAVLQAEIEHISAIPDWLVHHDYLADVNTGCYFHEFAAELPARGLQFLGDADLPSMIPYGFSPAVKEALKHLGGDAVGEGQVLDFLKNRAFRMTAVCRAGLPLEHSFTGRKLSDLHLSVQAAEGSDGSFRTRGGRSFETDHDGIRAALRALVAAWPLALPGSTFGDDEVVLEGLLQGVGAGLIRPSLGPLPCGPAGERPRATALARLLADRGPFVTNLLHENVRLGPEARHVLELLDGSRDRAALRKATVLPVDTILDEIAGRALLLA